MLAQIHVPWSQFFELSEEELEAVISTREENEVEGMEVEEATINVSMQETALPIGSTGEKTMDTEENTIDDFTQEPASHVD